MNTERGGGRCQRNPVVLAREWQAVLDCQPRMTRADLSRQLGVSCARVTQVLRLLDLTPAVVEAIAALGDPLPRPAVSERGLRPLLGHSVAEQERALRRLLNTPA